MALRLTTAKTAPESRRPAAQRYSDLIKRLAIRK